MKRTFTQLSLMSIVVLSIETGCTSMTVPSFSSAKANVNKPKSTKADSSSWNPFKKADYPTPASMNVTWVQDVLSLPGKPNTRGFGGRFYFYNEKSQAIPVEGELVVYGFDDSKKVGQDKAGQDHVLESAEKKFCFTSEQFTSHFTESQLGASYSVWVPWDAAPGSAKQIMLIPTFKTKDGRVVRGSSATMHLPGKQSEKNDSFVTTSSSTIPINSTSAQPVVNANSWSLTDSSPATTTITVPSRSLRGGSLNTNGSLDVSAIESFNSSMLNASTLSAATAMQNANLTAGTNFGQPQNQSPLTAAQPVVPSGLISNTSTFAPGAAPGHGSMMLPPDMTKPQPMIAPIGPGSSKPNTYRTVNGLVQP